MCQVGGFDEDDHVHDPATILFIFPFLAHVTTQRSDADGYGVGGCGRVADRQVEHTVGRVGREPGQQLPAHPIQLAHVVPPEAAQEGPQRGWRLDRAAQYLLRPASAQRIGVVNVRLRRTTGQGRRHQRQHLVARIGPTWRISQINVMVNQLGQAQVMGQGDRKQQPRIGHQAVVVEGDMDAVRLLAW